MPYSYSSIGMAFIHPSLRCFNLEFKSMLGVRRDLKAEQKFARRSKEGDTKDVAWTKPPLCQRVHSSCGFQFAF